MEGLPWLASSSWLAFDRGVWLGVTTHWQLSVELANPSQEQAGWLLLGSYSRSGSSVVATVVAPLLSLVVTGVTSPPLLVVTGVTSSLCLVVTGVTVGR